MLAIMFHYFLAVFVNKVAVCFDNYQHRNLRLWIISVDCLLIRIARLISNKVPSEG
jgi:hypothetical protein